MSSLSSRISSAYTSTKKAMNGHTVMLVFAVILLFISFIWLVGLSGVQTGSSNTSGFGSIVLSSQIDDGTVNPTYEVVAEFFIILFTIMGVAMLTYVLTIKRAASKLIDEKQLKAALIVNGSKNVSSDINQEATAAQLQNDLAILGYQPDAIARGLSSMKDTTKAVGAGVGGAVYGAGAGAYRNAKDYYNKSRQQSMEKRKKAMKSDTDEDEDGDEDGSEDSADPNAADVMADISSR